MKFEVIICNGKGNASKGGRLWKTQEGTGKCRRARAKKGNPWETGKAAAMKPMESFTVSI